MKLFFPFFQKNHQLAYCFYFQIFLRQRIKNSNCSNFHLTNYELISVKVYEKKGIQNMSFHHRTRANRLDPKGSAKQGNHTSSTRDLTGVNSLNTCCNHREPTLSKRI